MNEIGKKLNFLENISAHGAAVDLNHGILMLGALMSAKPINILEIGIGTAFCSELLLQGIKYNQIGKLTCVDNLHDLNGNLPIDTLNYLKDKQVSIAVQSEKDFVFSRQENEFDFLVSDGDHNHAHEWTDQIFKIMKPDSFMFFHDVMEKGYSLIEYKNQAEKLGKPYYLFNISSRAEEKCERGWLMIINKKHD